MFESPFAEGIIQRAREKGLVDLDLVDIRDFAHDRHRTVDDYQFGGGPGMLMKPEPLFEAVEAIRCQESLIRRAPTILLSPQGRPLTQAVVEELSGHRDLLLICGRYGGIDDRVREHLVTHEISIGDYVISGGELAAMVIIEAVSRLVPGVVGSNESVQGDSFTTGLLQHPQYTRPDRFRGWSVPEVLTSGNHAEVDRWRRRQSLLRTRRRRPELLEAADLSEADIRFLEELDRTETGPAQPATREESI
jgi:tRNA (guanine37-N1)-methyltransferase